MPAHPPSADEHRREYVGQRLVRTPFARGPRARCSPGRRAAGISTRLVGGRRSVLQGSQGGRRAHRAAIGLRDCDPHAIRHACSAGLGSPKPTKARSIGSMTRSSRASPTAPDGQADVRHRFRESTFLNGPTNQRLAHQPTRRQGPVRHDVLECAVIGESSAAVTASYTACPADHPPWANSVSTHAQRADVGRTSAAPLSPRVNCFRRRSTVLTPAYSATSAGCFAWEQRGPRRAKSARSKRGLLKIG